MVSTTPPKSRAAPTRATLTPTTTASPTMMRSSARPIPSTPTPMVMASMMAPRSASVRIPLETASQRILDLSLSVSIASGFVGIHDAAVTVTIDAIAHPTAGETMLVLSSGATWHVQPDDTAITADWSTGDHVLILLPVN